MVIRVAKHLVWSTATSKPRKLAAMVTFQLESIKTVAVESVSMSPHTFAAQGMFWLRVTHAARNKTNQTAKFMVSTIPRRPVVTALLLLVCSQRAAVKPVYHRMQCVVNSTTKSTPASTRAVFYLTAAWLDITKHRAHAATVPLSQDPVDCAAVNISTILPRKCAAVVLQ